MIKIKYFLNKIKSNPSSTDELKKKKKKKKKKLKVLICIKNCSILKL